MRGCVKKKKGGRARTHIINTAAHWFWLVIAGPAVVASQLPLQMHAVHVHGCGRTPTAIPVYIQVPE